MKNNYRFIEVDRELLHALLRVLALTILKGKKNKKADTRAERTARDLTRRQRRREKKAK